MEKEKVVNVAGTLRKMEVGDVVTFQGLKGSTVRNAAARAKEDLGYCISVNKVSTNAFKAIRYA